jgi:hypothetical protein
MTENPQSSPYRIAVQSTAPYEEDPWTAPIPPRKRPAWWLLIPVLVALMFVWEAFQPPSLGSGRFQLVIDGPVAHAYGTTDTESFAEVRAALNANPQIETIVLRDVPGTRDMFQNTRIAKMIRGRGINTHLESSSRIASGGVDLFLAGAERTMECGAWIGVHSWKNVDGETPKSLGYDPALPYMQDFHAEIGVDPDFYPFARDASPHELLYILQPRDIERFDLLSEPCERGGLFGWLG